MEIEQRLSEYGKKYISLSELASIAKINEYETEVLYQYISGLSDRGIITPVASSDMNGNKKYPLHKKYRINRNDSLIDQEILMRIRRLHPMLLKSGYLARNPKEFISNAEVIECLSKFLFKGFSKEYISRKERSFEIFGHEKSLDSKETKTLLHNLRISDEDLRFYDTPEYCFHDYIPIRKSQMTLLICENKDIWFNIRRLMFEDNISEIFGVAIDGVVYGNGNKVSQKQGALTEYVKFMGNPMVKFLYWGDIDREGFEIYRRVSEVNESLEITLFIPGYQEMIKCARDIQNEDSPSSRLENRSFDDLLENFSEDEKEFLRNIFRDNKLIPQEIISYQYLIKEGTDASYGYQNNAGWIRE